MTYLQQLAPHAQWALVVKSNAYGHGILPIVQLAHEQARITMLCTATASEALAVRAAGWARDILVMSYIDIPLATCVAHQLDLVVYDTTQALQLVTESAAQKLTLNIHLKVDTGMGRLGVLPDQVSGVLDILRSYQGIHLSGIMTHLSDTNGADRSYTHQQLAIWNEVIRLVQAEVPYRVHVHALASGALDEPTQYDVVRIGSCIYGNHKTSELLCRLQSKSPVCSLTQLMTWKTRCIQIKHIPAGSYIGYNRTYKATRDMIIGVLPVGYADGYPRALSNRGHVRIGDLLCPVVGLISMSLMTIDMTHVPPDKWHDAVILTGPYPGVTLHDLAQASGMLVNNITTNIPEHVARIMVENQP